MKAREVSLYVQLNGFSNLGFEWGWVVKVTPRPFYLRVRDTLPIVQ